MTIYEIKDNFPRISTETVNDFLKNFALRNDKEFKSPVTIGKYLMNMSDLEEIFDLSSFHINEDNFKEIISSVLSSISS